MGWKISWRCGFRSSCGKISFSGHHFGITFRLDAKAVPRFLQIDCVCHESRMQDSYNAFDSINEISSCLFHYAAEDDELIPDYRQKKLNDQAGSKGGNCSYFMVGAGRHHNDVAWDLNYKNKLTEFLEKTVSFES